MAEKEPRKARKGSANKGSPPRMSWKVVVLVVACISIGGLFFLFHHAPTSSSSVSDWVKQQDFDPVTPFRSDYTPGTLLSIGKYRDRIAMEAGTFLEGNQQSVTRAKVPDVVLNLKLNASTTGEGGGAKIIGSEELKAALELSDISVLTLPLNRVRDRVKGNTRVMDALAKNPADLFVILEALQVGKIRLTFNDAREAAAKVQSLTKQLRATFGLSGSLDQSGTVQSSGPLILGTRLARLSEASTALGGSAREMRVDKVPLPELQRFRTEIASRVGRLYSNYDIYGLVISLGNYPTRSRRAGGELPDAVRTTEMVSADLQRLVPPEDADHIKVITSSELSPRTFDPTRRLSRSDVLAAVHDFAQDVKKRANPQKQALVVFYFFGHGLADGISKSVFLVPEQFADDESRSVPDISDRLVNLADVARELSEVTDRAVILADACRAHQDQAKQLIDTWKEGLQQGSDVGGILNALQFASGIYGPTPIVFASKDGTAADTVKYSASNPDARTGPLAAKLRAIFDKVDSEGGGLTLAALIHAFETETTPTKDLTPEEAAKVRGYTFFRKDFEEKLGSGLVVSGDPVEVLPRSHAFLPPGWGLDSRAGTGVADGGVTPSGVTQPQLQSVPTKQDIQELVWAPGIGLSALDEANNVWIRSGATWKILQEHFPIMHIGFDDRYGLLLFQWDERILYGFKSGKMSPVYTKFFSDFLGTSAGSGTVIAQPLGGDAFQLLYADNGQIRELARVRATLVFDAALDSHNRLWFTTAEGLFLQHEKRTTAVAANLRKPHTLAAVKDALFVWSEDGQILYRVDVGTGLTEALDLRDVGFGDSYIRRFETRTMALSGAGDAYFGFGSDVVELNLRQAKWHAVSPEPLRLD
jgi:Caspase domain